MKFALGFISRENPDSQWELEHGPFVFTREGEVFHDPCAPFGYGWEWWLQQEIYPVAVPCDQRENLLTTPIALLEAPHGH